MESIFAVLVFIFGLLIGSFINVLSLRFGFSENSRPRSECQACTKQLHWYELVPLVSYIVLCGKCSVCESKISLQYPLVELLTGVLFAWAYLAALPLLNVLALVPLVLVFAFWALFVLLLVYDVRHTLVPLHFVLPLFAVAVLLRVYEWAVFDFTFVLYDALFGFVALAGFIGLIVLVTRGRGMGVGDIYVAGVLGVFFGFVKGIEVLTLAFWIGAVVGVGMVLYSRIAHYLRTKKLYSQTTDRVEKGDRKGFRMKSEVAFVPFLFVAAVLGAYTDISAFELVNVITQLLWY